MGDLFTGQSKKSQSLALTGFNWLNKDPRVQGFANQGAQAGNTMGALLGLGGDKAASDAAFQNYLNSSGYQFQLGEGQRAITSSNAAQGLLNSGAALKRLNRFGQGLAQTGFQNYLNNVNTVADRGANMLQAIGQAGSSGGGNAAQYGGDGGAGLFGSVVGGVLGMFSDERLKRNVKHFARDKHGIDWYTWEWNELAKRKLNLEGKSAGVMAQSLKGTPYERALGERDGYTTVKYWMLPDATKEEA